MLRRLRSAVALLVLVVATLVLGGLIWLMSLGRRRPRSAFRLSRLWARLILAACGVRLVVEGRERIEPATPYVYISNHQSALDIPVLMRALPGHFGFLAKRELFHIFFFGKVMELTGQIPVDRDEEVTAIRSMREGARALQSGSVVVFPEGTRSPTEQMLPFKGGGFLLARNAGRPIVPVAILGTQRILHPRRPLSLGPAGTVRVVIGQPIASREGRPAEKMAEVRRSIEEVLKQPGPGALGSRHMA